MASDDFIVELLHAEKVRLMERLDKAQQKMKTEFNTEDAAELGRIADTLQKVCKRLEVNTNVTDTGNSNSAWPANSPSNQPKYEVLSAEDFLASTETNLNLDIGFASPATEGLRASGLSYTSTPAMEWPASRRPDMIECIKCHNFKDSQSYGNNLYCSNCVDAARHILRAISPISIDSRGTSHSHLQISSTPTEECAILRSGLPKPHRDEGLSNSPPTPLEHRQTSNKQVDKLPERHTHDEQPALPENHEAAPRTKMAQFPQVFPATKYTHVIKIDGKPVELACYICQANSTIETHRYFSGAFGYRQHVRKHASEVGLDADVIFERAKNRGGLLKVHDEDVSRINAGKEPVHIRKPFRGKQPDQEEPNKSTTTGQQILKKAHREVVTHLISYKPREFDQLHKSDYPTIVFINGAWYAISCHICGANAYSAGNKYGCLFDGLEGLTSHMMDKHIVNISAEEFEAKDWTKAANLCHGIELSDEDVVRIRGGKTPKLSIKATYGPRKTWKEASTPHVSPPSFGNTKKSMYRSSAGSNTTGRFSGDTIKEGENIFVQFTTKASASNLQTARPSQEHRQHPDNQRLSKLTQKNKQSDRSLLDTDTPDRHLSHTAFSRKAPTEYEQLQGIVAGAKNGEDYVTPSEKRKRGKKRQRAEIDYDYDNGTSQSESSEEEPLSRRRTRSFEG